MAAAPAAEARGCAGARHGSASARYAARTVCAINAARARYGARPLRASRRLRRAARGHARSMVGRRYFAHRGPWSGAPTLRRRVARTGYLRGARRFGVGELLGYQRRFNAGALVAAWLRSGSHRGVLLRGSWRDVGVGIARGTPLGGRGVTVAVDFARR